MRISHEYRFIFFSNPKTGSESIRELLAPCSDVEVIPYRKQTKQVPFYPHMSPSETKAIFEQRGWDYEGYFKFVCVRNPWARLVSLYEMILDQPVLTARLKNFIPHGLNRRVNKLIYPRFSSWLRASKPYGTGGGGRKSQRWRRYGTYSLDNYIMDASGNVLVDKVIKLEEINAQLMPVLRTLNIPDLKSLEIPFINRRKQETTYHSYYTPETARLVMERYQYEICEFGYSFDG